MLKTTRTKVSKASPGIRKILEAAQLGDWTGRKVTVVEVDRDTWTSTQWCDDRDIVTAVCLDDMSAARAPSPVYGGEAVVHRAHEGVAMVFHVRGYGYEQVEIVVPAGEDYRGAIDQAALMVLVDACLAKAPAKTRRALAELTSAHVGMRGIAAALAEARAKDLVRAESLRDRPVMTINGAGQVRVAAGV